MSDDENDVHTPTQSEFATFEILANRDYTNMSKRKPKSKDLRHSFPVDVVEEESQSQHEDELNVKEEINEKRSVASSISIPTSIQPPIEQELESEPPSPQSAPPPPPQPIYHNQNQNTETKKPYKDTIENEIRDEKEGLLTELLALGESGQCKLVRNLTMNDSLEEISFQ